MQIRKAYFFRVRIILDSIRALWCAAPWSWGRVPCWQHRTHLHREAAEALQNQSFRTGTQIKPSDQFYTFQWQNLSERIFFGTAFEAQFEHRLTHNLVSTIVVAEHDALVHDLTVLGVTLAVRRHLDYVKLRFHRGACAVDGLLQLGVAPARSSAAKGCVQGHKWWCRTRLWRQWGWGKLKFHQFTTYYYFFITW